MTNLNEQMEMFDKEMSERKELDKLNKLFSKGVPFLKEQFSKEELENKVERLTYLKNLYNNKLLNYVINDLLVTFSDKNPKYLILNRELKKKNS